jgi:hypothetical protein
MTEYPLSAFAVPPFTFMIGTRSLRRCAPPCLSALDSAFLAGKAVGGYAMKRAASAPVAQSAFPALHAAGAEFTRRSVCAKEGQFRAAPACPELVEGLRSPRWSFVSQI